MSSVLGLIELGFDPLLRLAGFEVRWQTIGVTAVLLSVIALLARQVTSVAAPPPTAGPSPATRLTSDGRSVFPDAPSLDPVPRPRARRHSDLRLDDLLLILAGIAPGAVLGGRLVHGLDYLDSYSAAPLSLFDPGLGSLSLSGAVLGGLVTALYVAYLVGAPVRRWADVAAVPLLLIMGLGKVAQFLGGSGQGLPFDGPWAVAFTGAGPWVSASPGLPSHPAQLYEAAWLLIGIPLIGRLRARWLPSGAASGGLLVGVLLWFFLGRVVVGFFWRDPDLLGPLNAEQALALVAFALTLVLAPRVIVEVTQRHKNVRTPPTAQEPRS